MKDKEKLKRNKDFQIIQSNAKTLYEAFSSDLVKGHLPKDLSFSDIDFWGNQLNCKHFSLKDRVTLFKKSQNRVLLKDANWLSAFRSIINNINPEKTLRVKKKKLAVEIPFQLVLRPFVEYANQKVLQQTPSIYNHLTKKALQSCLEYLLKALSNMSAKALVADFSNQVEIDYTTYCASFYQKHYVSFFQEYSSLARLLTAQTSLWVDSISIFISHFEKDKAQLSESFFGGKKIRKIKFLYQDDGPAHSDLGPSRIITFSDDSQLVYKTKSAQNDLFYNRLIQWVNKVDKNIHFDTYTVYDRKDYSWHEFIPNKDCKSKKEVKDYYVRLGYLSALLQILGSTDYHYGNIIAKGGQPMLIDHETILNLNSPKRAFDIGQAHILKGEIQNYSLLGAFDFEVAYNMSSIKITKSKKLKQFNQREYWTGKNIPHILGRRVNPCAFKTQLKSGYALGLKRMLKQQKSFTSFIRNQLSLLELSHRYLHRPSIEYLLLLLNSYEPCHLKSGISRSIYFESLFQRLGNNKPDSFTLYIISQELVSVGHNFWPRFILNTGEKLALKKRLKNSMITKKNYVRKQIIKNLQHMKKEGNLEKEIDNLSKYLNHLPSA